MSRLNTTETMATTTRVMTDAELDAEIKRMGDEVASEDRVEVRLPKDQSSNANDQVQYVCINGHEFWIPRMVTVSLPGSVVTLLKEVEAL